MKRRFLTLNEYFVSNIKTYSLLNESGYAIENARSMTQDEVKKVYKYVQDKIFPILGLEGEGIDTVPISSYGKKDINQLSGDIDIAVSVDKIASSNSCALSNVLDKIVELLKNKGFSIDVRSGFNQVSVGVPIPGTNDVGQVDLMLSTNLEWSKFMYYSPDFTKAESKYWIFQNR